MFQKRKDRLYYQFEIIFYKEGDSDTDVKLPKSLLPSVINYL